MILYIDVTAISAWVFPFYPLRRLKLFTAVRVSRIIYVRLDFSLLLSFSLRTFILRDWDHGLHATRSSRLVETFLILDLWTFVLSPTSQLLFFPLLLAITFQFPAIPPRAPNSFSPSFVDAVALRLPALIH